jgi:hypothetical protein
MPSDNNDLTIDKVHINCEDNPDTGTTLVHIVTTAENGADTYVVVIVDYIIRPELLSWLQFGKVLLLYIYAHGGHHVWILNQGKLTLREVDFNAADCIGDRVLYSSPAYDVVADYRDGELSLAVQYTPMATEIQLERLPSVLGRDGYRGWWKTEGDELYAFSHPYPIVSGNTKFSVWYYCWDCDCNAYCLAQMVTLDYDELKDGDVFGTHIATIGIYDIYADICDGELQVHSLAIEAFHEDTDVCKYRDGCGEYPVDWLCINGVAMVEIKESWNGARCFVDDRGDVYILVVNKCFPSVEIRKYVIIGSKFRCKKYQWLNIVFATYDINHSDPSDSFPIDVDSGWLYFWNYRTDTFLRYNAGSDSAANDIYKRAFVDAQGLVLK